MASAAYRPDLTLTPFRHFYTLAEPGMLADSLFERRSLDFDDRIIEEADAAVPKVIPLGDRMAFEAAVSQWFDDTLFDSLPGDMKEHASFATIVRDGERVVPLIAAHLRLKPSFLFLALEEITGADPVPEEALGNLRATVDAWLRWLRT